MTSLKLEEIMVRDVMTRGVVSVQGDVMLSKIAEIMTEGDISCMSS